MTLEYNSENDIYPFMAVLTRRGFRRVIALRGVALLERFLEGFLELQQLTTNLVEPSNFRRGSTRRQGIGFNRVTNSGQIKCLKSSLDAKWERRIIAVSKLCLAK